MTPRWLYWALQAACLYIVLGELAGLVDTFVHRDGLQHVPVGRARLVARPFVYIVFIGALWWRWFQHEREGARIFALAASAVLWLGGVVAWLNASVNDIHYPAWYSIGYPLVGLVFLAYGIRGRERG